MSRFMRYRLWSPGNPQNRVFFTDFYMALMSPTQPTPPNQVWFKCPAEMTKFDIKNYLQKIYNVPVARVNTRVVFAKVWRDHKNRRIKPEPDYKMAYVTLGEGMTFEFPDIYPEEKKDQEKDMIENLKKEQKKKDASWAREGGLPGWFSL
ncbi:large ribosomal subunit protein uL23m-like [Ptychodera flava]|uniref:large ribosomal subunit protein uL23m-like n=1 Tax=Ptychodera flava TaxID=63121 RepID=UPI00396A57AF